VANGRFKLSGPLNVPCLVAFGTKGKKSFSPPSIFHPIRFYLNLFSIDFKVLFYHGYRPLLHIFPYFSLTYKLQSRISSYQIFHTLNTKLILIEDFFPFPELMALCMITSYGPQASQMNKKPPRESSIDLTLPQHFCDEDLKLREVRPHLEIKPFRIWYD